MPTSTIESRYHRLRERVELEAEQGVSLRRERGPNRLPYVTGGRYRNFLLAMRPGESRDVPADFNISSLRADAYLLNARRHEGFSIRRTAAGHSVTRIGDPD